MVHLSFVHLFDLYFGHERHDTRFGCKLTHFHDQTLLFGRVIEQFEQFLIRIFLSRIIRQLVRIQACQLYCFIDSVVDVTKFVHDTDLLTLGTKPNTSFTDRLDVALLYVTTLCTTAGKEVIAALDHLLHESTLGVIETIVEHPLPIHSIYILGHELGDGLDKSVMHGENIFRDEDGNIIQIPANNDYINGLTHTVTFVIAPLTKKNVKTHLDKLLTIFSDTAPNSQIIELDEYYDDSEDYRTIMRVLQKASADKQLRGDLDLEQYVWNNQLKMERRTQELQGRIDEMDAQLSQKEARLTQQKAQLTQQKAQLSQQQAQLAAAIKALSATNSAAQIAQILNIGQQQVEEILNAEA